jgi:hypothetical protein
VYEWDLLELEFIEPGHIVPNPIRKQQVAAASKSKTNFGKLQKTRKLYLGLHLVLKTIALLNHL